MPTIIQFMNTYVPYDSSVWQQWWRSIMTTIKSGSSVGLIIFGALCAVSILIRVVNSFMNS